MEFPRNFPHCNFLLDDGDVYVHFLKQHGDEKKALESAECFGWTPENRVRFSKLTSKYCRETDRTEGYFCPKCNCEIKI